MQQSFIGVDVGTASARAGLFDAEGTLLATARRPIALWHEPGDIVEQSSEDIWQACAGAIRDVLKQVGPAARVGRRDRLRRHLLARGAGCRRHGR